MLKRLPAVLTAMLLTVATYAIAAEVRNDHPTTYTVKRGDTLWDIAGRFLKKPWLWPEIWQANPQVKNPHLIYPGDQLSLVYVNGRAQVRADGPRVGEAIDTIPLARIQPFLKQLTVVNDIKNLPYVLGLEEDRLLTSAGQVVYVRGMGDAQPGQLVSVVRPMVVYGVGAAVFEGDSNYSRAGVSLLDYRGREDHHHWSSVEPLSKRERHGKTLGYELMRHATAEVMRLQGEVTVLLLRDEGRDVRVGDRIVPLETAPYDSRFMPHPPASLPPGAKVLAVTDGDSIAGPNVVVALNVGASNGIDNGTVFSIWHEGPRRKDSIKHSDSWSAQADKVEMPDDYLGHVMIFRTFDKISYGLVMESIRPTKVNDVLRHPDATQ